MTAHPANISAFIDAARDSVGREIATLRREAQRERDAFSAELRAVRAEWETRLSAVSEIERRLAERLASLKDGVDGKDGRDGTDGRDGSDGERGADGQSVAVEDCEPLIKAHSERIAAETAERILAGWERPQDGKGVTVEELAPLVAETVERAVSAIPAPKDGKDGADGRAGDPGPKGEKGERGDNGAPGIAGKDGLDGKDGERGPEGPMGALPVVKAWEDRVYYQGEVVSLDGSAFQANRDTGKAPPHDDWTCIVSRGSDGVDGRSFTIRGTYGAADEYRALDVVALNGASFAAKRDNPGPCPGDGWQLIAAQGKQGKPGEKGQPGMGLRGLPGEPVKAMRVSNDGVLTLVNGDGSEVQCDLYDLLSRLG